MSENIRAAFITFVVIGMFCSRFIALKAKVIKPRHSTDNKRNICSIFTISLTQNYSYFIIAIVAATLTVITEAKKDGVQHCNDKMRELILDSCRSLNSVYKIRRESRQVHAIESNDILESEDDFSVQFLANESKWDPN